MQLRLLASCAIACLISCDQQPPPALATDPGTCGDAVVNGAEYCDDGDTVDSGNGCSGTCQRVGLCGDGIRQSLAEACDDGNRRDGDCCGANCAAETAGRYCHGNSKSGWVWLR
jgi:cysteine-rich repeat protein